MTSPDDMDSIWLTAQQFPQQFRTLQLATVDAQGMPEASYAPYVRHGGAYWVFVSELSAHARNLLAQPRCGVLFVVEESKARNLFARERLSLRCRAQEFARSSLEFAAVMPLFREQFGPVVDVLLELPDFHLFGLTPIEGQYVAGFGKAYPLPPDRL